MYDTGATVQAVAKAFSEVGIAKVDVFPDAQGAASWKSV